MSSQAIKNLWLTPVNIRPTADANPKYHHFLSANSPLPQPQTLRVSRTLLPPGQPQIHLVGPSWELKLFTCRKHPARAFLSPPLPSFLLLPLKLSIVLPATEVRLIQKLSPEASGKTRVRITSARPANQITKPGLTSCFLERTKTRSCRLFRSPRHWAQMLALPRCDWTRREVTEDEVSLLGIFKRLLQDLCTGYGHGRKQRQTV